MDRSTLRCHRQSHVGRACAVRQQTNPERPRSLLPSNGAVLHDGRLVVISAVRAVHPFACVLVSICHPAVPDGWLCS